ncbi:hypothetical protein E8E12_000100, partial [Didymella heteroderae]
PVLAKCWEQVPIGIKLMNEICDAISTGSDFTSWSGLIIVVAVLIGLVICASKQDWSWLDRASWSSDDDNDSQDRLLLRDPSPRWVRAHTRDFPQEYSPGQPQDLPQQMLEVRLFQWAGLDRFESAIAEQSVSTYDDDDDDDVQWWHYFVGESGNDWDEVQVLALIVFMTFVYFVGGVMVWIMVIMVWIMVIMVWIMVP